jgi:signal peptidase I
MESPTPGPIEHSRKTPWLRRGLHVLAWYLLVSVGAWVMFWQIQHFALKAYRIPSSAMEPTLHCARPSPGCEASASDRVVVLRLHPFWTPTRRDVVAFRTPPKAKTRCGVGGTFVKRIIGLPGERVQIKLRGGMAFVNVDGSVLEEPYIEDDRRDIGPAESFTVPDDSYFVMGDNRSQSCDSRVFGPVPRDNFVGPVVARYLPLGRIGSP